MADDRKCIGIIESYKDVHTYMKHVANSLSVVTFHVTCAFISIGFDL